MLEETFSDHSGNLGTGLSLANTKPLVSDQNQSEQGRQTAAADFSVAQRITEHSFHFSVQLTTPFCLNEVR